MRRIHITGGPGSGKTTFATRLAGELAVPVLKLDSLAFEREADRAAVDDIATIVSGLADNVVAIAASESWVAEGTYVTWTKPLFERADVVVWLDVSWRPAAFRILKRHVLAELRRSNPFPGWMRLARFWLWSRRYYANTNPKAHNPWGTPETRTYLQQFLSAYPEKLIVCRNQTDLDRVVQRLRSE